MYVMVDWKLSESVITALKAAGYQCSKRTNTGNDDHGVSVTVSPDTSTEAHKIISNIIR